jgi:predicted RNA methylase
MRDTKKLPDRVLGIISRLVWTNEAGEVVARITDGQLDRKDYVALNEALEVLGGKWSRKLKGHLFSAYPKEALEDLLLTGEFRRATAGDFFQTPPELAKRMVEWAVREGNSVLEPQAGLGRIAEAVLAWRPSSRMRLVERDEDRCAALRSRFKGESVECLDFLTCTTDRLGVFDAIVMNPPFSKAQECAHIEHALGFLAAGGRLISVASAGMRYRQDRSYVALRSRLDKLGAQIEDLPEDTFKDEGTSVRTVLIKIQA